jgi:hypothetical protein
MPANTGLCRRNALVDFIADRNFAQCRVTVSASVRAPRIFLARRTSKGSISQVFLTVAGSAPFPSPPRRVSYRASRACNRTAALTRADAHQPTPVLVPKALDLRSGEAPLSLMPISPLAALEGRTVSLPGSSGCRTPVRPITNGCMRTSPSPRRSAKIGSPCRKC